VVVVAHLSEIARCRRLRKRAARNIFNMTDLTHTRRRCVHIAVNTNRVFRIDFVRFVRQCERRHGRTDSTSNNTQSRHIERERERTGAEVLERLGKVTLLLANAAQHTLCDTAARKTVSAAHTHTHTHTHSESVCATERRRSVTKARTSRVSRCSTATQRGCSHASPAASQLAVYAHLFRHACALRRRRHAPTPARRRRRHSASAAPAQHCQHNATWKRTRTRTCSANCVCASQSAHFAMDDKVSKRHRNETTQRTNSQNGNLAARVRVRRRQLQYTLVLHLCIASRTTTQRSV
jgi:hypothetical protein